MNLNANINLIKLYDRFKKKRTPTVCSRFLLLFSAHDVKKNQIPSFFGYGLTLEDVHNEKRLLRKLDEIILNAACELFRVRREWLDCADNQVYDVHHVRGEHNYFMQLLDRLRMTNRPIQSYLYLSTTKKWELDTLFVISEEIGNIGEKSIFRYQLCGGWIHKYWKDRPDITHCIASTLKRETPYLLGHRVKGSLKTFCLGLELPSAINTLKTDNRKLANEPWHPDFWLFNPHDFVAGISEGEFGKANALALWLKLYHEGALEAGYNRNPPVEEFEALLDRYSLSRS